MCRLPIIDVLIGILIELGLFSIEKSVNRFCFFDF